MKSKSECDRVYARLSECVLLFELTWPALPLYKCTKVLMGWLHCDRGQLFLLAIYKNTHKPHRAASCIHIITTCGICNDPPDLWPVSCPKWLWHPSLAVCKLVLCSNTLLISRINRPCEFHTHSGIIKNIKHAQYFITFNAWNKSILQIYTLLVLIYCCYISLSNHSEASGETITHFLQAGCLDLL